MRIQLFLFQGSQKKTFMLQINFPWKSIYSFEKILYTENITFQRFQLIQSISSNKGKLKKYLILNGPRVEKYQVHYCLTNLPAKNPKNSCNFHHN